MFENIDETAKKIEYFILDDARIWSVRDAKFVSEVPEGEYSDACHAVDGKTSVEVLSEHLDLNGLPKGELKTDEEYASEVRAKRDALLAETDFMMMPDYPLPDDKRQAVAAYRQFLRDVPAQSGFPRQINWPLKTF